MGLFDAYQFSPQGYGGQQGGLLDLVRQYQQMPQGAQQGPSGFLNDGPVSYPVFGQPAAQNTDVTTPPNAQPASGPLPPQYQLAMQQQPQQGGGFLESIRDNGILGSLLGQGGARNQTAQALIANGLDPQLAAVVVKDPQLLRAIIPQLGGIGGRTDDIKEYEYAKRSGFQGSLETWMQRKRAGAGEYGMTPIWGTDVNGKPSVLQLGKSGAAIASQMPPGFSLARDPVKVEGPTGTVLLDPQSRQQVGFIPKDVAGAAKAKEVGEAEGQALVNLPTAIATAENTLKTITQLKEHPGKKNWGAFGIGGMLPDVPGTDTRGFGALADQVKGQNFMTAFQSLKGAGAITEQEGAKAERAQARLDRAQSEKDFDIALKDLEDVVKAGMERARQKAGVKHNQSTATPTSAPEWQDAGDGIKIRKVR